ncbi:MAG: HIG1 domain-containing protein [Magnetospirillum sp.]|nr:HIG1 domain-containing protein [Magnetospirillum sp.]
MHAAIPFLLMGALGAVVLVLLVGVLSFAKGGPWYQRHANHLMNARVAAQALAVALLAAAVFLNL